MSTASGVVLRTTRLTKRYGKRLAVDALDLEVESGRVYGFLGPNGAGKSTTIGMILGLVAMHGGRVELFGLDASRHRERALRRVGATLEGHAHFPHLSGRDNLRVWARISGVDEGRIDEVLRTTGLETRKHDKVRTYSLGMKQRLAVAAAILHDPDLVILDEPTNGLDPAGIREFRTLVHELRARGRTVFVSSHILAEVEQMCDEVAIIKSGRLMLQKSVAELRASASGLTCRTTDDARAARVLAALPWVREVSAGDGGLALDAPAERGADISRALAEAGVYLHELRPQDSSLESLFFEITMEGAADA